MAGLKPYKHGYYLWRYLPSLVAAALFMSLFLSAAIAHSWRIYKKRTWFCIPLLVGSYMEFIGYAVRIAAREKTDRLMPFAVQSSYILLSPVLFAATIYMTLGRIIRSIPDGQLYSPINPRWLTKIFVSGDIVVLCMQAGASGLMFHQSTVKIGNGVVVGSLILQLLLFGAFSGTIIIFHDRSRQALTADKDTSNKLRQSLYMLYVVSGFVIARSIFRLVEYIGGQDGYLFTTEWPLYVFDALPMWLVLVMFYFWYPSGLQASTSKMTESDTVESQTELK